MGFGLLRVLNDDQVAPGRGFGTHPHDNMEIISIPLSGALSHRDDMGNSTVIRTGDVQIMSAGTGVSHSEFNHSSSLPVNFLQLWILPKRIDIAPRYDQKTFHASRRINQWQLLVSPRHSEAVWINQDAFLSRADLEKGLQLNYNLHVPGHGVYLFVLEGSLKVQDHLLNRRDALGLWELESFEAEALSPCELLLIEVPMS